MAAAMAATAAVRGRDPQVSSFFHVFFFAQLTPPDEQQDRENKKKGSLGYPFLFEVCFPLYCPFLPMEHMYT